MKARHRKHRASGGMAADMAAGSTNGMTASAAQEAAKQAKGSVSADTLRDAMSSMGKKEGGKVKGEASKHRADRKPRKNGGRAGSNMNPFSSARNGTNPPGHKASIAD